MKNLASCVLAKNLRRLRSDWRQRFHEDLWLVESFVDPSYFRSTVYKAANWRFLGSTQGYTKWGEGHLYHGRIKHVYVYLLEFGLWVILECSSTLLITPPKLEEFLPISKMRRIYERGDGILDSLTERLSAKQAIVIASASLLGATLCLGTTVGVVASQEECAGPSKQD